MRTIAAGGRSIAPELAEVIWEDSSDPLTDRERTVLRLAAEGKSNRDIASILSLSPGTVRNYLSEATQKLSAANPIDAARIARANGWL